MREPMYIPIVNIPNPTIHSGGTTPVQVIIQDSNGHPIQPPPGSILGIGSCPARPGGLNLVDRWSSAIFNSPQSTTDITLYAGQNDSGQSQQNVVVAVLVWPDQSGRLAISCSSQPVTVTILP
ncbi:MAG: hypothetical protein V2G42_03965 [bacterium JZ-2024 1]